MFLFWIVHCGIWDRCIVGLGNLVNYLHVKYVDIKYMGFRCPSGDSSWCLIRLAEAAGEEPGPHKENVRNGISYEVVQAMVPVYKGMSDPNLLKRLSKGKTQNNNECLHSVVWGRCPKTVFVSVHKVGGAFAAAAVGSFNAGAQSLARVMDELDIESNNVLSAHLEDVDAKCLKQALACGHEDKNIAVLQNREAPGMCGSTERGGALIWDWDWYGTVYIGVDWGGFSEKLSFSVSHTWFYLTSIF